MAIRIQYAVLIALFLSVAASPAILAESAPRPKSITLGHEDQNAFPWVFRGRDGSHVGADIALVRALGKELGVAISTAPYPWQKCLEEMKSGSIDGVFASSYSAEREQYGRYPVRGDGADDGSKMIHSSGYALYTLRHATISFDGKVVVGLKGAVSAQTNYSIVAPLRELGIPVDDSSTDPFIVLSNVKEKKVEAAALQTARADRILSLHPDLSSMILKHNLDLKPFGDKPYFLMLSHQFVSKYPEFSLELWNAVEKIRNSEEYKSAMENIYQYQQ